MSAKPARQKRDLTIVKPDIAAEPVGVGAYLDKKKARGVRKAPALVPDASVTPTALRPAVDTGDRARDSTLWQYRMSEATGSVHMEVFDSIIGSLVMAVGDGNLENQAAVTEALAHMLDIAPRDGIEGMLAAQMVATFKAGMLELGIAQRQVASEVRASRFNNAAKLMRLFAQQLETLNRGRGKGGSEQRIVVERVVVQEGGQAIVGNVSAPGGLKQNA